MEEKIRVQLDDNSHSIEHTLRPISYTSWLLGVGFACPRKCSKTITIVLRTIYLTVWFLSVIYRIIYFIFLVPDEIFEYIFFMNNVMCYTSAFYYIFHGIRHYNKWLELMDKMKELDQKITRETSMNNRHMKIAQALAILVMFACCPLPLFATYYNYFHIFTHLMGMFISDLLLHLIVAQSLISSFVFDVVVYGLYYRFQTINKFIGQLNELSSASWVALKIRRIRELHTGICDLVIMVNDIHGFHLLFCSMNCFTMVVATLFKLYIVVAKKNYAFVLINNILCILYTAQFGLMCWICSLARRESDRTGRIIYEILSWKPVNPDKLNDMRNQSNLELRLTLEDSDNEQNSNWGNSHNLNYVVMENLLRKNLNRDCVRNEINDFSIQLQHHRVAFTACDFFEINNALFSGFVGVIITYLIVFIQFYQQPSKSNQLLQHLLNLF